MPEVLTKNSSITFVELAANSGGKLDSPLMIDTYTGINLPTRAIELLKEILTGKGWTDVVAINPRYNMSPGILDGMDLKRIMTSPCLGISFITRTAPQSEELARRYKAANPRGVVIAGGAHATFAVEETLKWADYVVRYEGDKTLPELMDALKENRSGKGIRGVSYKDGDQIVNEPDRPLLTEKQLEELPWPQFDPKFREGRVNASTVIASRGCPHKCPFCSVTLMNGLCYRRLGNEFVLPRVREIYNTHPNDRIFLADDNFAGKPKKAEDLLRQLIDEKLNAPRYMMQLHPTIGLHKGFPDLVREAGVFLAAFGIESINQESLTALGKNSLSVKTTIEGMRAFKEAGVPSLGMFINGVDGDNREKLREQLEWAKKSVDLVQFFVPAPLPGTALAQEMEDQGRILTRDYCLYDGQHVVIRPKEISPYDLQMLIYEMNEDFLSYRLGKDRIQKPASKLDIITRLYAGNVLRNVRNAFNDPQTQRHLQNLKASS